MAAIHVQLFGNFAAWCGEKELAESHASKVQELFSYLLLHRDRACRRETLSSLLWGDCPTSQSKKYLRQALWLLQQGLDVEAQTTCHAVLLVEPDWIRIDPEAHLDLDVATFEQAFNLVRGIQGRDLDPEKALELQMAARLYRGDLLEGCYEDWCLYERERFQNMLLTMLDKLMEYGEVQGQYEVALTYGERILSYDRAHERTHQRTMRLHYLRGDRAAALRQYERCITALQDELGVKPAKSTVTLYEQIREDRLGDLAAPPSLSALLTENLNSPLPELVGHLKQLHNLLADTQQRLVQEIEPLEAILHRLRERQRSSQLPDLN